MRALFDVSGMKFSSKEADDMDHLIPLGWVINQPWEPTTPQALWHEWGLDYQDFEGPVYRVVWGVDDEHVAIRFTAEGATHIHVHCFDNETASTKSWHYKIEYSEVAT